MEYRKLTDLKELPGNPRKIDAKQFDILCKSIEENKDYFEARPLILSDRTAELVILGGNQRFKAAKKLNLKEVPTHLISGLTEEKEKELIIRDNVSNGEWDYDILANEWEQSDLLEWGLTLPDFAIEAPEATEDDYEIPDTIETDIVLGDLFEIGPHRLLCGSSTEADAVAKLLNGKEPYLMVTDPPYGVKYDASWRDEAAKFSPSMGNRKDSANGKVENDDNADWTEAWALSPSKVAYIWHADKFSGIVQKSLEDCNFHIRCQIIWAKSHLVIGRGDYHHKHEPCWYAVKKGNKGNWASDRKQTTVWEIDKPQKNETGHSTQKPVECMAKPIANHDGDVYEPFNGSGTTMVASHQLGRKVYAMELKPEYCQMTIDRMLKLDPSLEIKRNGQPYFKNYEVTT